MSDENANLTVCLEQSSQPLQNDEFLPAHNGGPWPISAFTSKLKNDQYESGENKSSKIRKFYRRQDQLIRSFEEIYSREGNSIEDDSAKVSAMLDRTHRKALFYSKLTFSLNVVLMIVKAIAAVFTGSMTVIGSLIDSSVDLASGVVMWIVLKLVKKKDLLRYPQGKTRLEPVGIVILCAIMTVASAELIVRSIDRIIQYSNGTGPEIQMDPFSIALLGFTIVSKFALVVIALKPKSHTIQTLAMDNKNDVLSNSFALIFGLIGAYLWKYIDPIGAILVALYIIFTWVQRGLETTKSLIGRTADPYFLQKISFICCNHSPFIKHLETLRAFHIGNNYLVEVDIVLPEAMELKKAHDIGETLQQKLELLPDVERAFVHLDYDFEHQPTQEHKIV